MCNYYINKISADGYERIAEIETPNGTKLTGRFLEHIEYLNKAEKSKIRQQGDVLKCSLLIGLVTKSSKCDADITYRQNIPNSPHIEAIVQVTEVKDEYTVYAKSNIDDMILPIEFESRQEYKVNDILLVEGELELLIG